MSIHPLKLGLLLVVFAILARQGNAQTSYSTNFDALAVGSSILTSSSGSGQWVDASGSSSATVSNNAGVYQSSNLNNYVIYQGDISNLFTRISPDNSGVVVAQLLAQVVWCDSGMPDNSICLGRQGGVCVSNGYAYAWSTNGWLQLTNQLDARQTIASNSWTKFTFAASYLDTANSIVYYKVYVDGTNFVPVDASQRYDYVTSAFVQSSAGNFIRSSATFTSGTKGITGLYLSGSGAIDVPSVAPSSSFVPTSSAIDIRAYQGTDATGASGVIVEFTSRDEEGGGTFTVTAKNAAGAIVWSGSVVAVGSGNNRYRILAPGLLTGSAYRIEIVDEAGNSWNASGVNVGTFAADTVKMERIGLTIQFVTIPDRYYNIEWTPKLGSGWTPVVTNLHAVNSSTNVFVPFPDREAPSGFFRILMH